jgi:hypothetical protein
VTDCAKLARSDFAGKCAILIYGFEDPERLLNGLIGRDLSDPQTDSPGRQSFGVPAVGMQVLQSRFHGECLHLSCT